MIAVIAHTWVVSSVLCWPLVGWLIFPFRNTKLVKAMKIFAVFAAVLSNISFFLLTSKLLSEMKTVAIDLSIGLMARIVFLEGMAIAIVIIAVVSIIKKKF